MRAFIIALLFAVVAVVAVAGGSISGMDPSPTPPVPAVGDCRIVVRRDALPSEWQPASTGCTVLTYETAFQRAELLR